MPNKNQYEQYGIHRGSCYKTVGNSWKYNCPHKNINYSSINNGINCLCSGMPMDRSSGDKAQLSGKKWPIANPSLGWK